MTEGNSQDFSARLIFRSPWLYVWFAVALVTSPLTFLWFLVLGIMAVVVGMAMSQRGLLATGLGLALRQPHIQFSACCRIYRNRCGSVCSLRVGVGNVGTARIRRSVLSRRSPISHQQQPDYRSGESNGSGDATHAKKNRRNSESAGEQGGAKANQTEQCHGNK
ncbi:hypothetical protein [Arthrobacter pigmenti]